MKLSELKELVDELIANGDGEKRVLLEDNETLLSTFDYYDDGNQIFIKLISDNIK